MKADVCKMAADLCKRANHVDADDHKRVRFEIMVDNNNDNSKQQQHDDEGNRVWNKRVGMCKLSFEGSNVEISTSIANTTSTKIRATTNDDDNDEDNDKARRATPSIIHAQTLHPAGEGTSSRFPIELPKPNLPP